MSSVVEGHPAEPIGDAAATLSPDRLRESGARIQSLLEASSAGGTAARERAEELVRLVVDLYGDGLERMLDLLFDAGRLDDLALAALADDQLVASLLLVHGLHPYDVTTRVQQALKSVRPYLASHGGDVELIEVTASDIVRLRLLGSCDGCPSSSVTLTLAVEDAVTAAAPEIAGIEVESPTTVAKATAGLIPVDSLRARVRDVTPTASAGWAAAPELAELAPGEVRAVTVAGIALVTCRVGSDLFAYRDRCSRCNAGFAGAVLGRRMGGEVGAAVLACPSCGEHYDVRGAGVGLDDPRQHLDPLPLLVRNDVVSVALPGVVPA